MDRPAAMHELDVSLEDYSSTEQAVISTWTAPRLSSEPGKYFPDTGIALERRRIAAELHDGLGQSLCSIAHSIEEYVDNVRGSEDDPNLQPLARALAQAREAVGELRRIVSDVQPASLDRDGVIETIGQLCGDTASGAARPLVRLRCDLAEHEVADELKLDILRVAQESLNNAVRHARAGRIVVGLFRSDSELRLRVEDDGCGMRAAVRTSGTGMGLGLDNMRHRVEQGGGRLSIRSQPKTGTTVEAVWPLPPRRRVSHIST